jgi:glucokinase
LQELPFTLLFPIFEPMNSATVILAGDIGGTKTNMAYVRVEAGSMKMGDSASYPSRNHVSFAGIVEHFVSDHPRRIDAAAFGIAGPVISGRCEATNLPWVVDTAEISRTLGNVPTVLINDLEATAYGVLHLEEKDRLSLNAGQAGPDGAIAVIAAGTGLGEGGLIWTGSRYMAIPSEGGHTDFAPRNELEIDLLRHLLRRHQRVSYERLISGPGLYALYEFFRERSGISEPAWLTAAMRDGDRSAAVSTAGMEGKDDACRMAIETFVSLYGAEAGNLALKLLARGGVYIAGGIAPKILPCFRDDTFISAFRSKGRFSPLLENMPVSVVLNDRTALLGATHVALTLIS